MGIKPALLLIGQNDVFPVCVQVLSVLPLAAVHTLGNLLTNVSLGQVAVSFTHTIKASAGRLLSVASLSVAVRLVIHDMQYLQPAPHF